MSQGVDRKNRPPRSRLRAALGDLKWYLIGRLDQFRMRRAEQLRAIQRPAIESLPALSWSGRSDVDVAMLCGRKHLDMGIAASWSLLRYAPDWRLLVCSDGTLSREDAQRWRSVVPSLRVIEKDEAAARMERRLGDFPLLRRMWSKNIYSSQLVDAHLAGDSPFLLLLDSDVLCFREPRELFERLQTGGARISWNGDLGSCYCAPKGQLEASLGYKLPDRVNAGVLVTPRFDEMHFRLMEEVIQRVGTAMNDPDWLQHPWLAQTVYAAMSARLIGSSILPSDYAVSTRLSKPGVMRHYVSIPGIRARFFKDGIPELLQQAEVFRQRGSDRAPAMADCLQGK